VCKLSFPAQIYRRFPKRLPYSIGFSRHSLYFNGANYGLVSDADSLTTPSAFTWMAWILYQKTSWPAGEDHSAIFAKDLYNREYWFDIDPSFRLDVRFASGGYVGASVGSIERNKWQHIAARWDGSEVRYYINGILDKIDPYVGSISNTAYDLYIGQMAGDRYHWIGRIAQILIYNRALSDGGISVGQKAGGELMYNILNYHSPIRTGLVLWLDMEEGTGLTAYDRSGYGNHASLLPVASPPSWTRDKMWALRAEAGL